MRLTPLILGCASVLLFVMHIGPSTPVLTFDKERLLSQFIRQLAEVKATELEVEKASKRFHAKLNNVLLNTAQQKKAIILNHKDVLAGGVDITEEVRVKLSHAMRGAS